VKTLKKRAHLGLNKLDIIVFTQLFFIILILAYYQGVMLSGLGMMRPLENRPIGPWDGSKKLRFFRFQRVFA
jgi:hypothetical protein